MQFLVLSVYVPFIHQLSILYPALPSSALSWILLHDVRTFLLAPIFCFSVLMASSWLLFSALLHR